MFGLNPLVGLSPQQAALLNLKPTARLLPGPLSFPLPSRAALPYASQGGSSVPKPSSSSTSYPTGSSGSLSGGTPGPVDYVLIANSWRKLLKLPAFKYNANLEAAAQNTQNKADGQYHLALGPEPGEVTFSSSGMLLSQPTASDVNDAFRTFICGMPELLTAAGIDYTNAQINLGKYGTMLAGCGKNSPAHSTAPSDSLALLHVKICSGKSTAIGCA
jgi:hypothetical protein